MSEKTEKDTVSTSTDDRRRARRTARRVAATWSATRWTRPSWSRSRTASSTRSTARSCGARSKVKAHDEANAAGAGDLVLIMETRPLSATKRWRVVEILEKAK